MKSLKFGAVLPVLFSLTAFLSSAHAEPSEPLHFNQLKLIRESDYLEKVVGCIKSINSQTKSDVTSQETNQIGSDINHYSFTAVTKNNQICQCSFKLNERDIVPIAECVPN